MNDYLFYVSFIFELQAFFGHRPAFASLIRTIGKVDELRFAGEGGFDCDGAFIPAPTARCLRVLREMRVGDEFDAVNITAALKTQEEVLAFAFDHARLGSEKTFLPRPILADLFTPNYDGPCEFRYFMDIAASSGEVTTVLYDKRIQDGKDDAILRAMAQLDSCREVVALGNHRVRHQGHVGILQVESRNEDRTHLHCETLFVLAEKKASEAVWTDDSARALDWSIYS